LKKAGNQHICRP